MRLLFKLSFTSATVKTMVRQCKVCRKSSIHLTFFHRRTSTRVTLHAVIIEPDRHQETLRQLLLGVNTITLLIALLQIALSLYMIFWIELYWWGVASLLIGIFATLVALIYYPLIWKSIRLDAAKVVLIWITISHLVDAGVTVYHVVEKSKVRNEEEYKLFTSIKGLHLGVIFSTFAYYWRLYNISLP